MNERFINQHKLSAQDFTRTRKLSFQALILCLIKKGSKSIQNVLNELYMNELINDTVSASAYTQARKKLKHTAFQELNANVLKTFHSEAKLNRYKNYRLLGVDGSKLNLPDHPEIANHFGKILNTNQTGMVRYYSSGLFICCYDVLNKVCVGCDLVSSQVYEVDAFKAMSQQMEHQQENLALKLFDRGFASYEMISYLETTGQLYVIRIPRNSFKATHEMFLSDAAQDQIVMIDKHRVRFVRIVLSNGEIEVLATNVFDDLSVEDLQQIYQHRWGVETFFHLTKERLGLENFTGKTLGSVLQDFWSTILVCNLEASCTHELNQELQTVEKPKHVNSCVSFNVLKHKAFDLLFSNLPEEELTCQLRKLFLTNLIPIRRDRELPPRDPSLRRTIKHLKYRKKHVF